MASSLSNVLNGGLCSGCGGCTALVPDALRLEVSPCGFLRPEVLRDLTAEERGRIEDICPSVGQKLTGTGGKKDAIWGRYESLFQGFSNDDELRNEGASGGALSGFLVHLLQAKTVDGVVHVGADPSQPQRNMTCISYSAGDVLMRAGSRYAPSSPLDAVSGLLGSGKTYAFVGKPCDVSALAAWRAQDARVAQSFPVLVSFFCAGVPSLHGAAEVASSMGVLPQDLASFEYRGPGWPGAATAITAQGQTFKMSYPQSWGAILSKHVQHRCKICVDGSGAFADVVFGDAWEADADGYPSFEDRPGQSAILVRTPLGAALMDAAVAAGSLSRSPLDPAALTAMQPGQVRRRKVVLARLLGLWLTGRAVPQYRGFGLLRMTLKARPSELARNCLGIMRRALALPRKGTRI